MKEAGQTVLVRFPHVDLTEGKLRPALMLAPIPGPFDDWLICMITAQLHQAVAGFDEIVRMEDEDFELSGLKTHSLIRLGRVASVKADVLEGSIGAISETRLSQIRGRLADWLHTGRFSDT